MESQSPRAAEGRSTSGSGGLTAVFLDRDGTVIHDLGYIDDPGKVRLIPGASEAIRRFSRAGYLVVIVSNQSGVARGLFDEEDLSRVHARLEELLDEQGASLDGAYYCPYLAGAVATVEAYRRDSELRKPQAGMLLQAARELGIDLSRSWMIGDSPCDIEAGYRAGCDTILVRNDGHCSGVGPNDSSVKPTHFVDSLLEAARIVEGEMKQDQQEKPATGSSQREDRMVEVLEQIQRQLDRAQRQDRQLDFSLVRLCGALLQMFAIVTAVWGVIALFDDQAATAAARLVLACFMQLAALSAFAVDRFR